MKKELLFSAALGAGLLAIPAATSAQQLASRAKKAPVAKEAQRLAPAKNKRMTVQRADEVNPSEYGTIQDILFEDFSLMTKGSVGAPDMDDEITYVREDGNAWMTMKDGYTAQSGWGGGNIFQAGGTVAIANESEGGHLNTCMMDVSGNDRVAFLEFKVRTDDGKPAQKIVVEGAETYNMAPSWDVLGSGLIEDVTDEWKTYRVMFQNCGAYSMFNFAHFAMEYGEVLNNIYFDDIRVFQVTPYITMPELMVHANYTGDSFQARWYSVEGAEKYLLNVYTVDATHENMQTYVVKDLELTDTVYTVTGIDSGYEYYYTVQAVDAEGHKSFAPTAMLVCDLVAPEPVASDIDQEKESYKVSWDAVPSAERYNYWAFSDRKAEADGPFVITQEDYNEVTMPAGTQWSDYFTEEDWKKSSVTDPGYYTLDNYVVTPANQGGWVAKNGLPLGDGCIKVDGYHYIYNGQDAGLVSPELDLSKGDGKIDLSVKLWGEAEHVWYEDGSEGELTVECAVALFNWDENKQDFTQAELVYLKDLDLSWQERTVQLTKGTSRSIIGIYAVTSPANLFIDDLTITQNYKAGEVLRDPFLFCRWYEGTSMDVQLPKRLNKTEINHRMSAIKTNPSTNAIVESQPSELEAVGFFESTGVKSASLLSNATVLVENGSIVVNGNGTVQVFRLDGSLVAKAEANGQARIAVPAGAYIVKVNGQSVKVVF